MSPVHTGGTARPVWLCALALLPWARHCRGHCLNVMRPSGALLCVNSWTGLCQPPGVPWGMKQYPEALQKWLDVFYLWPWKVVARLTGDGLCFHHDVIAVGNKLLLADCQPLSCPPGPEEAQETKCHDQDVAEPRTASNSGCETMHGTRAGKATGQELRQLHSPTTSVQRGGHLGWLVTFCSPTGSGQRAPHHSTMVGSRMMLAAPPGAGHGWDCSKAGEAIRFWEWQREWLSTEKSYPSSTAGLSRCICNIISLKGSAYKTQNSFSCNIHTQKGKKCPAFFDREGGKTL